VHQAVELLAAKRPVFYNEADLQHSIAWEMHLAHPDSEFRLEMPAFGGRLDLFAVIEGLRLAVELKYPRARFAATIDAEPEPYSRDSSDANDDTRYAIVKDIERLERMVDDGRADVGCLLLLTNESAYWRTPRVPSAALDSAFRIHEGAVLSGLLDWGAGGRSKLPIKLRGHYTAGWRDYSELPDSSTKGASAFRYLALFVESPGPDPEPAAS
jgi:hypothetical protein